MLENIDWKEIKLIVFGGDNVLIDVSDNLIFRTLPSYVKALRDTGNSRHSSWCLQDVLDLQGKSPKEIFGNKKIWLNKGEEAKEIFYDTYKSIQLKARQRNNIAELLTKISVNFPHIELACLGNKTESILMLELQEANLSDFFLSGKRTMIFGAVEHNNPETGEADKPSIKSMLRVMETAGVKNSEEVVYFCREKDRAFAKKCGVNYCHFDYADEVSKFF